MKRCLCLVLAMFLLTGCGQADGLSDMTKLRDAMLQMEFCTFDAVICADYGETSYTFTVTCRSERDGTTAFTMKEPQTIAGIGGKIQNQAGQLIYEDVVLGFPLLADGEVSPVSAPWIMIKTLLGGYIRSYGAEAPYTHVVLDDSYAESALQVDVWLGEDALPIYAEIVWQNRRVLSIEVENFQIV